jgi:uncharacterized protein (TIRG00374 family)
MSVKQGLRLIVSFILTGFFIWLIARQINGDELKQAFNNADSTWIVAGFCAFFVGYACRIQRWRLMLQCDNPALRWRQCGGPLFVSFAANNVLPFRAGDVMRVFAFNRQLGVSSGIVAATLFVERLLDLLMVLILLGTALAFFKLDVNGFTGIGSLSLIAIAFGILLLLLFPKLFAPLAIMLGNGVLRFSPKLGQKLLDEINKGLLTLVHLSKGGMMVKLVLWSIFAWLAEGCLFWCAGLALTTVTFPLSGWLALPVGTLATLIPSTPGYVGTFDYFTVRAMCELGNSVAAATAYALLVHILLWLPPTFIGGIYLLFHPLKKHNALKVV